MQLQIFKLLTTNLSVAKKALEESENDITQKALTQQAPEHISAKVAYLQIIAQKLCDLQTLEKQCAANLPK